MHRLERAWKKPDTIIVHEPWWTATAKRADIVFPVTTPLEREGIGRSPNDAYIFHMAKLIEPVGESCNDYDIFCQRAARLGAETAFTEGRNAADWQRHLYERFRQNAARDGIEVPTLEDLKDQNWVKLPIEGIEHVTTPFAVFRTNPEAHPLGTPSGRIAGFGYDESPGHPVWREPGEWLGSPGVANHPLHIV